MRGLRTGSTYTFLQRLSQAWMMKNYFLLSSVFIYRCFLVWPMHLWLFSCWIILYSVTYVCVCTWLYIYIIVRRLEERIWHWEMYKISRDCIERWFYCNPSWLDTSNLLFSSAKWMFLFIFPGLLVSICMRCSGGLLYRKEEHNILLVCLALWHLNKLERCINLAKDRGQSDGWTGIISHFSCAVFIAINFKQGNRLQGVCCIRKEVCTLLWLIGILV